MTRMRREEFPHVFFCNESRCRLGLFGLIASEGPNWCRCLCLWPWGWPLLSIFPMSIMNGVDKAEEKLKWSMSLGFDRQNNISLRFSDIIMNHSSDLQARDQFETSRDPTVNCASNGIVAISQKLIWTVSWKRHFQISMFRVFQVAWLLLPLFISRAWQGDKVFYGESFNIILAILQFPKLLPLLFQWTLKFLHLSTFIVKILLECFW